MNSVCSPADLLPKPFTAATNTVAVSPILRITRIMWRIKNAQKPSL